MRDEDVGQAQALLEIGQQVEDLGLDRHVQRGDRLVADDDLRARSQCAGDRQALALAARELVRVACLRVGGQPDQTQQLGYAGLALRAGERLVQQQRFSQHGACRHARVERAVGVLKHHLQPAAHAAQGLALQRAQVLAAQTDLARIGFDQSKQHAGHSGLTAAGLTHYGEGAASAHLEGHTIDRADMSRGAAEQALAHDEVLHQAAHLQQFVCRWPITLGDRQSWRR